MPRKRYKPEEIVAKLRQVVVLVSQGAGMTDAIRQILDDGRICLTNNAAKRALRGFALGRRSWLFAGSERGADRAAAMATLIQRAKLNDVDPQAGLADVLSRINEHAIHRLKELLPWNSQTQSARLAA